MEGDFFEGVEQIEAVMAGRKAKTPTFYRDARSFTLIFAAKLLALKRLMPDPRYIPAQILPGIGAVHLTAFEYYDTDIDPYNEFAIGVLLNSPYFLQIPCYNELRQLIQNSFYTYIHHLPVTTEIALRGGIDLYNYPKFLASIEFEDYAEWITCRLSENGQSICNLHGKKIPATRSGTMKFFCQLYQFKQPQSAEFKVNARQYAIVPGWKNSRIELGSHSIAQELKELLISTTPLLYIYIPSMQAILYGPEHLSLAAIGLFMERGLGIPPAKLAKLLSQPRAKKASSKPSARKRQATAKE